MNTPNGDPHEIPNGAHPETRLRPDVRQIAVGTLPSVTNPVVDDVHPEYKLHRATRGGMAGVGAHYMAVWTRIRSGVLDAHRGHSEDTLQERGFRVARTILE